MSNPIEPLIAEKIRILFGADAKLTALTALAGDASSRRYYRGRLSAGAPASLVVMALPAGSALPLSSDELAIFKEVPNELPFLNLHRFLSSVDVNVPKIYGQWQKEGIIFLEDLGDTALWDRVQGLSDNEVTAWYRKAIDELLKLQVRGTAHRDPSCIAFQQRFDLKLYLWEFEHFIEWGLVKRPGAKVVPSLLDALRKVFGEIAAILDRQSGCLNHRDYHSWNLMIHNDAVRVIDFQDALLAPPQYDLASLLNDRITDSVIRQPIEEDLVRYYVDRRRALTGQSIIDEEFFEIYRLSAIQRDLKVVGRFYYLDQVKNKPGYMKFVPPTVRRLIRNLAKAPQTKAILPPLLDHFEAML
ncbi:MAG: aminoglycoside phosphotransferase family protein [Chloroflexota bacterium]